jgi:hypothetical protein
MYTKKLQPSESMNGAALTIYLLTLPVTDTLAYYNIYLVLRHTESYHLQQHLDQFYIIPPSGKTAKATLNLILANRTDGSARHG